MRREKRRNEWAKQKADSSKEHISEHPTYFRGTLYCHSQWGFGLSLAEELSLGVMSGLERWYGSTERTDVFRRGDPKQYNLERSRKLWRGIKFKSFSPEKDE